MEINNAKRADSPLVRVPTFTELATFAAATLYVLGFVIANVYYASYEIVRLEFFRARYVAAALLFVFTALFPGWMGWQIGAQFRRSEPKPRRERRTIAAIQLLLMSLVTAAMIHFILIAIGIGVTPFSGIFLFAFLVECTFATVGSGAAKVARSSARLEVLHMSAGRPMIVGLAMVIAGGLFGRWIYPHVSPAYGGGAANLARIDVVPGTLSTQLQSELDRPVVVIDRDEQIVDLVACSDSISKITRPISLSSLNVRAIILGGLVSLPDAERQLCFHN